MHQQQQRERSCTRCQSFHRHHHRQRRRSSGLHQLQHNDFNAAASAGSSAAKVTNTIQAIINIAPTHLAQTTTSGSTLTVCSLPTSTQPMDSATTEVSTPVTTQTPVTKHCTFVLTPTTIPPPPNQISFLSTARYHPNLRPKPLLSPSLTPAVTPPVPTPTSIIVSSPSLVEIAATTSSLSTGISHHQDKRINNVEQDDIDDIVEEASTSSSMSSLGQQEEK